MIFKYYEARCDYCGKKWSSEGRQIHNRKDVKQHLRIHDYWLFTKVGFCYCSKTCKKKWTYNFNNPVIEDFDDSAKYV